MRLVAALLGAFHGGTGAVGLALFLLGGEEWSVLVSALALLSTPGALLLAPRDRVLAAAWLVGAAVVYLLTGPGAARRTLTYSLPYAGAQVVAAVALLLRRAPDADAEPSARPSVPVRALALGAVATVVALYHGILGLWLVMTFGQEGGWARGWWMADAASLLSTPPAVALAWVAPRPAGAWLLAAAGLGVLATLWAPNLAPTQLTRALLLWLAPQLALGAAFLWSGRRRRSRP